MSTIWAFDLGKGSIGEAVWNENQKESQRLSALAFISIIRAVRNRRVEVTRWPVSERSSLNAYSQRAGFDLRY